MPVIRKLICLYLSVAVFLGCAVLCRNAQSLTPADVTADAEAGEEAVTCAPDLSLQANEQTVTADTFAEPDEPSFEEPSVLSQQTSPVKDPAEPETKAEAEAETEAEAEIISFSEILSVKMQYHNDYTPAAANEKVSQLYLLSENTDSLSSENAVNVYTFTVEKRSVFSYTVTHAAPTGAEGWCFSLYEEYYVNGDGGEVAYRLIDTLRTTALTTDSSPEIGLSRGNYRLVAEKGASYSSAQYTINASLNESTEYETECNDNIYRYTEIYSGVSVKGSAAYHDDRQDDDYFLFRMYEDGFIELKFEHPTVKDKVSVCWQVLVFSEDGACMYSVNSLFTDSVNKSGKIGLDAGNYYVLIRNRVYTDITYTLTLSRTDNSDYENEKNDTIETADSISAGVTVTGNTASQINGIDRDYFRFELSEPGYCSLDFAHEPAAENADRNGWNITLLDVDGRVLSKSISAWGDDVSVTPAIGLSKGVYYVRIDSENLYLNSDKYYLTVNFTAASDWETEFNDTAAAADILFEAVPVKGIIADRGTDYDFDYYVIELSESADVTLSLSHEKLSYSKEIFNFTLYGADNNAVKAQDGQSVIRVKSDEESVTAVYKQLAAGRYYVRVSSGIFFDSIVYSLEYGKGE